MFAIKNQFNKSKKSKTNSAFNSSILFDIFKHHQAREGNQMTRSFSSHNHVCYTKTLWYFGNLLSLTDARLKMAGKKAKPTTAFFLSCQSQVRYLSLLFAARSADSRIVF